MPTPVGHLLAGAIIYRSHREFNIRFFLGVMFFALLPDIDLLFGVFVGDPNRYHHQFTHSFAFVIASGGIGGFIYARGLKKKTLISSAFFISAGTSHVILDVLAVDKREPFGCPLWWPLSRKVYQEGEAFFRVKEGKRFEVHTAPGITEVLGTTFTVYARKNRFTVTCHSGRVRVKKASSRHSVTLSINERADLKGSGEFEIRKVNVDPSSPAWEPMLVMFTSKPLRQVFDEIEKQFGVHIETPDDLNHIYTGNFTLDQSVDKIISLICRPFDLAYEKSSDSEYQILPSAVD